MVGLLMVGLLVVVVVVVGLLVVVVVEVVEDVEVVEVVVSGNDANGLLLNLGSSEVASASAEGNPSKLCTR